MLAINMIVNINPNVNAHVFEYAGMNMTLNRNPIMLIARKLDFSGAIFI